MVNKILLTGASGFLGRAVAKKLIQNNNYDIVALSRRGEISLSSPRIKWLKCDLSDSEMVKKISPIISEIQYVIHIAAQMPQKREDKNILPFINNNINATINLLKVLPVTTRQFIYCGSIDAYGVPSTIPINEHNLTQPKTYYGATKLFCEYLAKIHFQQNPTIVTILRFTQLYGPGEPKIKIIPLLIEHFLTKKEIFIENEGQDVRDYLFIEDAADAIIESLGKPLDSVFNISTGIGITIRHVIDTLESIAGGEIKINYLPVKVLSNCIIDNKKFCLVTDWRPKISLSEGLKKEYEFAHKNFLKCYQ